ncbi:MAG: hypothetical protein V4631_15605 [Pseudomonadota bacterium]
MREQWADMLRTGLATPRAPNQSQLNSMMTQALTKLVKDDCGGESSITPAPDSVLLDTLRTCQTLRADVEVVSVEGVPLFGGPRALPAMVAACSRNQAVELGLKDGATLRMPCRSPYQITQRFYAANMEKLAHQLMRD